MPGGGTSEGLPGDPKEGRRAHPRRGAHPVETGTHGREAAIYAALLPTWGHAVRNA